MNVAVVTGARSGLGLALTRRLLNAGWSVAALLRTPGLDDTEFAPFRADGRLRIYTGDLADAADRQRVVEEIAAAEPRIDALFNNAGISTGELLMSPQGRELNYEVNTIAPYVLTQGLLPNLERSGSARVINTSSSAVAYAKAYNPKALARPERFQKLFGPYSHSKLALSLWTQAAAPELSTRGVTILSVDPGGNRTPMTAGSGMPFPLLLLAKLFFQPASKGAQLLLDGWRDSHPPGAFVSGGQPKPLPFSETAAQTLQTVSAAARA